MNKTISRTLFLCTLFFLPQTIMAETPSPTQNQSSVIDANVSFGRLFTTPQERKTLNNKRQIYGFANPTPESGNQNEEKSTVLANAPQGHGSIKFSGVLIRADGQQQVWINGKLANGQPGFKTKQTIQGDKQHSATIKIPLRASQAKLKPGQVWVPTSKKVGESYLMLPNIPKKEASPVTPEEASPVIPKEASPVIPKEASPVIPKEASPVAPEKISPKTDTEPTTITQ